MIQSPNGGAHNRSVAFYNRGGFYRERKDYDRAIADYNDAVKLDPQFVNAYINRGMASDAKGDNDATTTAATSAAGKNTTTTARSPI